MRLPISRIKSCVAVAKFARLFGLIAVVLSGCDREATPAKSPALPETPWTKVKAEAQLLTKPPASLTRKLGKLEAALATASYPVMVPGDEAVLERLELVVKSHLYTAIAVFPTHRVEVLGVRSGRADEPDSLVLKDKRAEIQFVRWGVTYRVRIVCESVAQPDVSLCADGKLAQAIRDKLVWINPR